MAGTGKTEVTAYLDYLTLRLPVTGERVVGTGKTEITALSDYLHADKRTCGGERKDLNNLRKD